MFKCPRCSGKTKVLQTINGDSEVRRKLKCLHCDTYFFTKETFDDYTENTIRYLVKSGEMALPKDYKVRLEGKRTPDDKDWKNAVRPVNIDWDKMKERMQNFDDSGTIYDKGVD